MIKPYSYNSSIVDVSKLKPINTSLLVFEEQFLPNKQVISLSNYVESIVEVKKTNGEIISPSNYSLYNGNVVINALLQLPTSWINDRDPLSHYAAQSYRKDGSTIRLRWDYHENQLLVTYKTGTSIEQLRQIRPPNFNAKLTSSAQPTILFMGDSITAGGDSSNTLNKKPFKLSWAEYVAGKIALENKSLLSWNIAKGGESSNYLSAQQDKNNFVTADLIIIAFGMNDQAMRLPKEQFKSNVKNAILRQLFYNSSAEFVLVSSMRPEITWKYSFHEYLDLYRQALLEIKQELPKTHIAVADVTAAFDQIMRRKTFGDITSNGVNHPNDFGHSIYANIILNAIGF
jgi:lysophospholipase L1-like esterase